MSFPLSYKNKIEVSFEPGKHKPEKLRNCIIATLEKVKAKHIKSHNNHITFSGGVFRPVSNWNILVSVSSGIITIEKNQDRLCLKYTIKFTQTFIFTSIIVVGFLGPIILQAPNLTFIGKTGILAMAWCWLFGGNYLITTLRFSNFIKKMTETEKLTNH